MQFVDFSSKLITASVQLYKKGELDVHAQASSATNDILDFTVKLRRTLCAPDESATLTEDDILLESICEGCDDLARDLLARLDKLKAPEKNKLGRNIWPTLTAAFQSIWTKEELLNIKERLKEYRSQIDSRIIQSLSKRVDLKFLQQSERFDRLDAANKEIAAALVNHNASDDRGLQAQISALSTLLDRAEVVLASREDTNKRIIVDVFQQLALTSINQDGGHVLAKIRETDEEIREVVCNEVLNSLNFPSITARFEAVEESHATTFAWIFRHTEDTNQYAQGRRWDSFGDWLKVGKGIYWINGKAGSGKSTLMKYIVNHHRTSSLLRNWAGDSKLCISRFFFWNSGMKQQRSQAGLLRSLLYDILSQYPELLPTVLPAQWAARYSAECLGRHSPRESWEFSTLDLAFRALISQTSTSLKLCLFIDGLDEYEGNEDDIAGLFSQVTISENVKICCSSRPHQAFEDAFATLPGLRLQDLTLPDIREYIHDRLEKNVRMQRLNDKEPEATKELIEEIGNAASGVFLWVRLVVSSLLSGLGKYDDIHYLRMRLRELPEELDDLYHHMIFKVDKVYRQEAARLFQLVGAAFRNQDESLSLFSGRATKQLTVLMLSFALDRDATLALQAKVGFLKRDQAVERCKDMEIRLRTRCGGLLEVQYGHRNPQTTIVSPDMTVSYLHRTVKDYMELRETRQGLEDETGGQTKDAFKPSFAILKAHLLTLKALDAARIAERPPWALTEEAMIWAYRAEQETQTAQPEVLDEFGTTLCQICSDTRFSANRDEFFQRKEPMMTLASQHGLYRYLDAKLSQNNVMIGWNHSPSLLSYARSSQGNWETFVSPDVISVLLKYDAEAKQYLRSTRPAKESWPSLEESKLKAQLLKSAELRREDMNEEVKPKSPSLKISKPRKEDMNEEVKPNSHAVAKPRTEDMHENFMLSSPNLKVPKPRREKFGEHCCVQ